MSKTKQESSDRFVEIDVDNIDQEWIDQPRLYLKWSRRLADAKFRVSEADAEVDLTRAELDNAIRLKPSKYGLSREKITEAAIKQAILLQQEYLDSVSALNKAKHEEGLLQAGVNALDHKKRAMENLVTLIGLQWYSEPKAKKAGREAQRQIEQQSARKGYRRNRD